MGANVLRAVETADDLMLGAALECEGHAELGKEVARGVALTADLGSALEASDVAIDFSTPESTLALVAEAARRAAPLVIATTGIESAGLELIRASSARTPIVMAPNFSLGMNLLIELVREAARRLPGYEVEILEFHHSGKTDAPSGTALRLGEVIAEARGQELGRSAIYHREGQTGPRPPQAIGLQSLRAGDSAGEHTVYLAGPGERIELSHRALSREGFAWGAVRAARWVIDQPPGLYSMSDVLS